MTDVRPLADFEGPVVDADELVWVSRHIDNHAVIVQVAGEVDMVTRAIVEEQLYLAEALVVPPAPVVLDLTATAFFGSAGLALLAKHTRLCADLGGRLCVVAPNRAVLRPIVVSGLDDVVTVADSVARALATAH